MKTLRTGRLLEIYFTKLHLNMKPLNSLNIRETAETLFDVWVILEFVRLF